MTPLDERPEMRCWCGASNPSVHQAPDGYAHTYQPERRNRGRAAEVVVAFGDVTQERAEALVRAIDEFTDRRTSERPERRSGERFDDVLETMNRVHDQPDGTGTVKCARCLGTVRYEKQTVGRKRAARRRKSTGEVWSRGHCETEGCVSWIV